MPLAADARRTCWLFEGRLYWEDEELGESDVLALVRERERRVRRRLERAHAALARPLGGPSGRRPIPREVRRAVFERDGGRCVECGSGFELQYDHLIPLALGGGRRGGQPPAALRRLQPPQGSGARVRLCLATREPAD